MGLNTCACLCACAFSWLCVYVCVCVCVCVNCECVHIYKSMGVALGIRGVESIWSYGTKNGASEKM